MAETIVNQNTLERCRLTSKDIRLMASISSILNEEALDFGKEIVASRVREVIFSRAVKEIIGGEIKDVNVVYFKKRLKDDEFLSNMMKNTISLILVVSLLETSKYGVTSKCCYERGCKIYGVDTMSQEEIRSLSSDALSLVDSNIEVILKNIKSKLMSIVNVNKEKLSLIKSLEELSIDAEHSEEDVKEYFKNFTNITRALYPGARAGVSKKLENIFNTNEWSEESKIKWVREKKMSELFTKRKILILEVMEDERKWFGVKVKESDYLDKLVEATKTKKESFEDDKLADKYITKTLETLRVRYNKSNRLFSEIFHLADRFEKKQ